ncbi:polysaccharide biosynthesis/export family protein [Aliiroseovarius sp. S1123]|jgi:polysaccharide export outer membrane protein|uniref:polysaccharide biosynthesis/export family protein n=1 Tax=unclassified Aliiroseovarius TaxID=2623558 RepID=UPI001FF17890|nr:polysaccharide biosynthesis/export family protein [Aliiroseovarius sp. S1123]MCK0171607.1 polysaccharide biosynthesis/export family protein [Aliiroseovarius sp. S1123]
MRFVLIAVSVLALASCGAPRGAALQSEIVGGNAESSADLAVYTVSKATLPAIASWPAPNADGDYTWPSRGSAAVDKPIRPFDRVDVIVWDSEESSLLSSPSQNTVEMKNMLVSSGGTIFLPFVGSVHIAGMSHSAARARIQRKYVEAIPSAQVQLNVTQGTRGTVSMVSGVSRPGPITLDDPSFTVLHAIAASGGPDKSLNNPSIKLIRGNQTYLRPLAEVMSNASFDTYLRPGDKLALQDDSRYFRSLGAASKEALIPFSKSEISALDAMSLIGGLSDTRANPKGILILREYPQSAVRPDDQGPDNARSVFVIDLTTADGLFSADKFQIHSKDTVLVTESAIAASNTLLRLIRQLTGISFDISRL